MGFSITLAPKDGWKAEWRRIRRLLVIGASLLFIELMAYQTGLLHEGMGRYYQRTPLSPLPMQAKWIQTPETPFLDAGRDDFGDFSGHRLLLTWQATGMSSSQAHKVLDVASNLGPVVMGVNDPVLERTLRSDQVARTQKLHQDFPAIYSKLLEAKPLQDSLPPYDLHAGWDTVERRLVQMRSHAPGMHANGQEDRLVAQANLTRAVGESGIRVLQLGFVDEQSALIGSMAEGIRYQNEHMKALTGWQGRVLGLEGRVAINLQTPDTVQNAGITTDDPQDYIQVVGDWWALPHEWFHALDIVAARQAFEYGGRGTLTSNLRLFRKVRDQELVQYWQNALTGVVETETQWKRRRWGQVLIDLDPYLLSPSEAMAFAFGEFAIGGTHGRQHYQQHLMASQGWLPNPIETRRQAAHWKSLFVEIEPLIMLDGKLHPN